MTSNHRFASFLIAVCLLASGAAICSTRVAAQEEHWWVERAEYGTRSQHNDVTNLLKDLVARGGVNGRVAVNNQTMGGDPMVGADKTLRILARNARDEQREFNYREGSFVPVDMFRGRADDREYRDRDDHHGSSGGREDREDNSLQILRAFYGVQGRTIDVTEVLRSHTRGDALSFVVNNRVFGMDPVVGADKILIVVYRFQGAETAVAVREGNVLTLP